MNTRTFNMIVKKKRSHSSNPLGDRDRDGVKNMFDCQPNNPKKQGLIDDIAKGTARKFREKRAERAELKAIEVAAFKKEKMIVATEIGKRKAQSRSAAISRAMSRGAAKARRKERFISGTKKFAISAGKFIDTQTKNSKKKSKKPFDINKIDLGF